MDKIKLIEMKRLLKSNKYHYYGEIRLRFEGNSAKDIIELFKEGEYDEVTLFGKRRETEVLLGLTKMEITKFYMYELFDKVTNVFVDSTGVVEIDEKAYLDLLGDLNGVKVLMDIKEYHLCEKKNGNEKLILFKNKLKNLYYIIDEEEGYRLLSFYCGNLHNEKLMLQECEGVEGKAVRE